MCLTLGVKFLKLLVFGGTSLSKRVYAVNITMQNAEMLIGKIVFLVSYFMTVPIIGYCRAWAAEKVGDDTPAQFGFLTLNPAAHISWLWVALMTCIPSFNFGFGRYIPINPHNIHGRNRGWKLAVAYLSDAFASIVLATLALFLLVALYGQGEFFRSFAVLEGHLPFRSYDTPGSHNIAVALILSGFIIFNNLLAAFNIIVNLFYLGFFYYVDNNTQLAEHIEWIMLVGPLVLIVVCFPIVQPAILNLIAGLGSLFALLMGIN